MEQKSEDIEQNNKTNIKKWLKTDKEMEFNKGDKIIIDKLAKLGKDYYALFFAPQRRFYRSKDYWYALTSHENSSLEIFLKACKEILEENLDYRIGWVYYGRFVEEMKKKSFKFRVIEYNEKIKLYNEGKITKEEFDKIRKPTGFRKTTIDTAFYKYSDLFFNMRKGSSYDIKETYKRPKALKFNERFIYFLENYDIAEKFRAMQVIGYKAEREAKKKFIEENF